MLTERLLRPTADPAQQRRTLIDLCWLFLASVFLFGIASWLDAFERFNNWSRAHEAWQLDEFLILAAILTIAFAIFSWRRWHDLKKESRQRVQVEARLETLEKILPICSTCHKIRDTEGQWQLMERYLNETAGIDLSHGLCPDCFERHYADYATPPPQPAATQT